MPRPSLRPVMNPTFSLEDPAPKRKPRRLMKVAKLFFGVFGWLVKKLFSKPLRVKRTYEVETRLGRLVRGAFMRAMFLPLLLAIVTSVLVFTGTHPRVPNVISDPESLGMYHLPLEFTSEDGTELKGWLVPLVDAKRVLIHRDRLLNAKHPAVVLVHDFVQTPEQVLPLVSPLHDDGLIVVGVGLRGIGVKTARPRGQTFGLNESKDVAAAVEALRARPFVDGDRIAVVGVGTGANAALLCAERDPKLRAVVVVDPLESHKDAVAMRLGPTQRGTKWVQGLTKWTFEMWYRTDFDEIDMLRFQALMLSRPVERINGGLGTDGKLTDKTVEQVRAFCRKHIPQGEKSLVAPKPKKPAKTAKTAKAM